MHERTLGVHQIELVVNPGHDFRNRRAVRDHAARTHHLREVTTRHHGRRLVVDAALESSRGPVDELDRALGLDRRHRRIDVLGNDITAVHHAARLRSEVNIELNFPPNFEGLVLGCIDADFASKYALESSRRDLHNALLCTVL